MRSYVRQRGALAVIVADRLQTSAAALALQLQTVRGYADCCFRCTTLLLHSNVIARHTRAATCASSSSAIVLGVRLNDFRLTQDETLDPTRTSSRQLLSTKAHRHKLHRVSQAPIQCHQYAYVCAYIYTSRRFAADLSRHLSLPTVSDFKITSRVCQHLSMLCRYTAGAYVWLGVGSFLPASSLQVAAV